MIKTIKTLSSIKLLMFKGYHDLIFADKDQKENLNEYLEEWKNHFNVIAEIFDFQIDIKSILIKLDQKNSSQAF
jgi:hypothetical protein